MDETSGKQGRVAPKAPDARIPKLFATDKTSTTGIFASLRALSLAGSSAVRRGAERVEPKTARLKGEISRFTLAVKPVCVLEWEILMIAPRAIAPDRANDDIFGLCRELIEASVYR
jgi:hypothetical protein